PAQPLRAPAEDPVLAREKIHERSEGDHATRHEQGAHEALHVRATADDVDDDGVDTDVGEEEEEGARGVAGRDRAHEEKARGQEGRRLGRGEGPAEKGTRTEDELGRDQNDQEAHGPAEGRTPPLEAAPDDHGADPGGGGEEDQELRGGEERARVRAARQGRPQEGRVEKPDARALQRYRPALPPYERYR